MKIIGIAGGSGAGKSTLAFGLLDVFKDRVVIVHLDDYNKKREETPLLHGYPNWDDPESIRFDDLLADLESLTKGVPIKVGTKNERDNPDYNVTRERIMIEITPKPIIILEGYLALYDERIREKLTRSYFLDLPHGERVRRRTKQNNDDFYTENILMPMHKMHVEPTKKFADKIIDISEKDAAQVMAEVMESLRDLV